MTTKTMTTAPAVRGRERNCHQCGTTFRAPRKARFCSNACRMKGKRGTPPCLAEDVRPSDPAQFSLIGKLLFRGGLAGQIDPARHSARARPTFALTVQHALALAELQLIFDRRGWGALSEREFAHALENDGIGPFATDSEPTRQRRRFAALKTPKLAA